MYKTVANMAGGEQIKLSAEEMDKRAAEEAVDAEDKRLNGYKTARAFEYSSVSDQLDMMYWDNVNGTSTWVDHIAAVKVKHPKP